MKSILSLLLLSTLLACREDSVSTSQLNAVEAPNHNIIGHGFNPMRPALEEMERATAEVRPGESCVEYVDAQGKVVAPTARALTGVKDEYIRSYEKSQESTRISESEIKLDGRLMGNADIPQLAGANLSLDAGGSFSNSNNHSVKSHDTTIGVSAALVIFTQEFLPTAGTRPRILPSIVEEVKKQAPANRALFFQLKCGSGYIGQEKRGASLKADISIDGSSSAGLAETANKIAFQLEGNIKAPEVGDVLGNAELKIDGQFDINGKTEFGQGQNRQFMEIKVVSNGIDFVAVKDIKELAKSFANLKARKVTSTVPLDVHVQSYLQAANWNDLGIDLNVWSALGEDVASRMRMRQNLDDSLIAYNKAKGQLIALRNLKIFDPSVNFFLGDTQNGTFDPATDKFGQQIGHASYAIRAIDAAKKCLADMGKDAIGCMTQDVGADQANSVSLRSLSQQRNGLMQAAFILDPNFEENLGAGRKRYSNLEGLPLPRYVLPRRMLQYTYTMKALQGRYPEKNIDLVKSDNVPGKFYCRHSIDVNDVKMEATAPGITNEWDVTCEWRLSLGRVAKNWKVSFGYSVARFQREWDKGQVYVGGVAQRAGAESGSVNAGGEASFKVILEPDANLFYKGEMSASLSYILFEGPMPNHYLNRPGDLDLVASMQGQSF